MEQIMSMLSLRRPENHSGKAAKLKTTLKMYLLCLAATWIVMLLLRLLDMQLVRSYGFSIQNSLSSNITEMFGRYGSIILLYLILLGPLLEELTFRAFLSFKKSAVCLSLVLLTFFVTNDLSWTFGGQEISALLITVSIAIVFWFSVSQNLLDRINNNYFRYFFVGQLLVFGFMHMINYVPFNSEVLFFYPFFVLPQMVLGYFISVTRMREGFLYGFILHALINSLPALMLYIKMS